MKTLEESMRAKKIPLKRYSRIKSNDSDPNMAWQSALEMLFKGEEVEKAIYRRDFTKERKKERKNVERRF
jgi:hypothetical protein